MSNESVLRRVIEQAQLEAGTLDQLAKCQFYAVAPDGTVYRMLKFQLSGGFTFKQVEKTFT